MIEFFPPRLPQPEPNQYQWIREFSDTCRPDFNKELFKRTDEDLVESMKKVILSCQRKQGYFTIEVTGFDVIKDYTEIRRILYEYTEAKNAKKNKVRRVVENVYDFIDINHSDIFLLIVHYHAAVKEDIEKNKPAESRDFDVIIELPRIVDKYYYHIAGNHYLALIQIVDGSTYNNTMSNSKNKTITSKTIHSPIKICRMKTAMKTSMGQVLSPCSYQCNAFSKSFNVFKFYFAKMGVWDAIRFFEIGEDWDISKNDLSSDTMYCIPLKCGLNINVPMFLFDNDHITQSMVYAIYSVLNKQAPYENLKEELHRDITEEEYYAELLDSTFWVSELSREFTSVKGYPEKGISVLISFEEQLLDLLTQGDLHLPLEDKSDIYRYIRWMCREYHELRKKDITDLSYKKIRITDYIATIYSLKFSKGIFLASDAQKNVTIDDLRSYVYTEPDFLLKKMTKDKLVNFKNTVNDMDGIEALRFSYKGISGLGDQAGQSKGGDGKAKKRTSTIPKIFRYVHKSHIGKVELDTSSASDPGITGVLCPFVKLFGNSFTDYKEPNTWRGYYAELLTRYRDAKSKLELNKLNQMALTDIIDLDDDEIDDANEIVRMTSYVMDEMISLERNAIDDDEDYTDYDDDDIDEDDYSDMISEEDFDD